MSRYQEQLQNLEDKVETGLDCEIIKKEYAGTWMHYEFICDVKARRITVEQMEETDGCIRFMQHISWDYNRHPHALIVGDTGSGKTTFLLSIIETLRKAGRSLRLQTRKMRAWRLLRTYYLTYTIKLMIYERASKIFTSA